MGLGPSGSPSGGVQLGTAGDAASAMAARRTRGARPLRRRIDEAGARGSSGGGQTGMGYGPSGGGPSGMSPQPFFHDLPLP